MATTRIMVMTPIITPSMERAVRVLFEIIEENAIAKRSVFFIRLFMSKRMRICYFPILKCDNSLSVRGHISLVSYHNDSLPCLVKSRNQLHHFMGRRRVKSTSWLVSKDNIWIIYECTSNRDTLLLTS